MPLHSPICTKSVLRIQFHHLHPLICPPLPYPLFSLFFPPPLTLSNLQLCLFQASCPLRDPVQWGPFSGGLVGELLCQWQRNQAGDGPDAGAAAGILYQLAPAVAGRSAALCCQGMESQSLLWWVNQRLGLYGLTGTSTRLTKCAAEWEKHFWWQKYCLVDSHVCEERCWAKWCMC